ncbi:hypothetical protein RFI_35586, partial [Reticulomyxa filosa]
VRDSLAVAESVVPGATENLLNLIVSKLSNLGWEGPKDEDADIESLLRPLALSSIAKYGYQPVIDEALNRFRTFMNLRKLVLFNLLNYVNINDKQSGDNKSNIPSSLRSVVYAVVVKNGGKDEFYAIKKYYLTVQDSTERQWALISLGAVKDPELIQDCLEF